MSEEKLATFDNYFARKELHYGIISFHYISFEIKGGVFGTLTDVGVIV